ncbi:MAG: hypothetical protein KGJ13_10440 [Patescibacteria group bacterium]|nr:hypothetical protein [Patescibacteria group bacterium]
MSDYPRFTLTPTYPAGYSRDKVSAEQSAVPSQQGQMPQAYYPGQPADLLQPSGNARTGQIDNLAVVRAMFDSRPPYTFDFSWRDKFNGGAAVFGGFAVPPGYIAILRGLSIALFGPKGVGGTGLIDIYGEISNNLEIPQASLIINGGQQAQWTVPLSTNSPLANPIAGFSGLLAEDAYESCADLETFVVLPEGSICNINIPGWTDTLEMLVTVEYRGQLILNDGRVPQMQVGNSDPEPVRSE